MPCNSTYLTVTYEPKRESISWLYDVIDMRDIDFGYNETTEDVGEDEANVDKQLKRL